MHLFLNDQLIVPISSVDLHLGVCGMGMYWQKICTPYSSNKSDYLFIEVMNEMNEN